MTQKQFDNINFYQLNLEAKYIIEVSEPTSAYEWLGDNETIEEVNKAAIEIIEEYPDIFYDFKK